MKTKKCATQISPFKLKWLLVMLFSCICIGISAQPKEQFRFRNIGLNQGLPGSSVFAIHQDNYGFMWFGTREGLVRYDGRDIKSLNYLSDESINLNGKMITSIYEDGEGNLYMGVWEHGLYYYNRPQGRLSKLAIKSAAGVIASPFNVWTIVGDSLDNLYVGTLGQGLFMLSNDKSALIPYGIAGLTVPTGQSIHALLVTEDRYIWLASSDEGLQRIDLLDGTVITIYPDDPIKNTLQVRTLYADNQDNIWVGTHGEGLYHIQQKGNLRLKKYASINSGLATARIRAIQTDEMGRLWIGTDGDGVFVLEPLSGIHHHIKFYNEEEGSLSSNVIFAILRGNDNKMWLGTNKAGVDVWYPETRRIAKRIDWEGYPLMRQNMVMSVLEDKSFNIWMGTDGNGLYRLSPDGQKITVEKRLDGLAIKAIYEHSDGSLFFGTYGNGMWMRSKDGTNWTNFRHQLDNAASLCQDDVWDFAPEVNGRIWVATLNGGLCLFDPVTKSFERIAVQVSGQQLLPENILALACDYQGVLWIGTSRGLFTLQQFEGKYNLQKLSSEKYPSLLETEVKSIMIDKGNIVWVGTRGNGLYCVDLQGNIIRQFSVSDGLAANTIASVIEDANHAIWIATAGRLSRLTDGQNQLLHFDKDDGLSVVEYLSESAVLLKSGELIFGGVYGIDWVDPASVRLNQQVPSVFFTKLLVMNEEVVPSVKDGLLQSDIGFQTTIRLLHNENTFSLEFTALNYDFPDRSSFAYKLEGFDLQWNYIGNQRRVTFTNLDPGNYVLRVIASNADGVWNEEGASLEIVIVPPWWKTGLAKFGFSVLLLSALVFFLLRRANQDRKRRQELERLVASRTHDLEEEKKRVEGRNTDLLNAREELIQQNREILKQQHEIKAISEKLHEADKRKIDFFTGISHEIRTPLTLILSPVNQLIKEYSKKDEGLVKQLKTIQRNQHNLLGLVNQLLDFQKIDNNQMKLQAFPLPISDVIYEVLADFEDKIQTMQLHVEITGTTTSSEVWIDPLQFKKVLNNLISNAVKFTPEGGSISIILSEKFHQEASFLQLEVSDTGLGIDATDLESVFESFFQTKASKRSGNTGTGIGLSIARSIVEMHKGRIFAKKNPEKGVTFVIQLPLGKDHLKPDEMMIQVLVHAQSFIPSAEIIEPEELQQGTRKQASRQRKLPRILVVEDNRDLQLFLQSSFSVEYQVFIASDGLQGLHAALQYQPDLIVSDVIMPEMDGIDMLRQLKADTRTNHIPVILLTAKTLHQQRLEGLMAGADEYLSKPFTFEELNARAANLIKSRMLIREKFRLDKAEITDSLRLISADDQLLQRLYGLLEENYGNEDFGAAQLLKASGISRSGLHTRLKQQTGMSVTEFIRAFRLRKAAVLLQQNHLTVGEIAFKVGFSDVSYFNRCFRRQFGTSPGQYAVEMADENQILNNDPNDLNNSPTG